uniref:Uncharacterized protein n=1 Tax=Oryza rufipogon TaxID=4529 RepID=A0A0E0Q1K9_ORYRU
MTGLFMSEEKSKITMRAFNHNEKSTGVLVMLRGTKNVGFDAKEKLSITERKNVSSMLLGAWGQAKHDGTLLFPST